MVDHFMQNKNEDMISSHQVEKDQVPRINLTRWFRHFCYMPWRTRHYFNQQARQHIRQAVTQAESGHAGEIEVIIEGHLPLHLALRGNTQIRAKQLFAEYAVWDTAHNSGVLLYINLCEHQVEILADRGIHQCVDSNHWQHICEQVTILLSKADYVQAVVVGVQLMGETLNAFYADKLKDNGNELDDGAVFL